MTNSVSFQARARTIDHLGKGQIADTPTAISELWKNSYDAYARDVALHTFDREVKSGAVIDNGCGMTLDQLVNSWLVIGTNSKSQKKELPPSDSFGLLKRVTQGEKGIGRLSAAFLSPVTLLITKKINSSFSVILVDWRFFENPYLSLSDIKVPMTSIKELDELEGIFPSLVDGLKENLQINPNPDNSISSNIRKSWDYFSEDELSDPDLLQTTQDKILEFCNSYNFDSSILETWQPLLNKAADLDGSKHGTALYFLDLSRELELVTNFGDKAIDDTELRSIEDSLVDTLRSFFDPYIKEDFNFSYEIRSFSSSNFSRDILRQTDVFDREEFNALEHRVEGAIDERGWFRGNVTAFGKDMGEVIIPPSISIEQSGTKTGSFSLRLGAFEYAADMTSHGEREHSLILDKAKKHSGFLIFRDGLRVMPYGRTNNDFFNIEERRSLKAGRHFWSNRRLFGQILLTHEKNKNLKDKAGREGFILNQAARELRDIVAGLLIALADKFFGDNSEDRKLLLVIVKKERALRKEAQSKAKKVTQIAFVRDLNSQRPILDDDYITLKNSIDQVDYSALNEEHMNSLVETLKNLEARRGELKTPTKPPKIGNNEEKYRSYRDKYNEYSELLKTSSEKLNKASATAMSQSPVVIAKKKFDSNQGLLNAQLNKQEKLILSKLTTLESDWRKAASEDRKSYYSQAISILDSINQGTNLEATLNALDLVYLTLSDDFSVHYGSFLKALDRLEDGVNLDAAFSMSEEERTHFEEKASQLQSLAQLGISVEVLAHELEQQDALVTRGMNSLPSEVKNHPGFATAMNAHKALTEQIRFLSPLKLSGYQARRKISGRDIKSHIMKFFRGRFERQRVTLQFGEDFLNISLNDLPSRIYPVFINIISNALYWVCINPKGNREIKIDFIKNLVIIANSGPPVDEDDIAKLFDLFYSKRANGHGVGLYLCKENLAVAHHKIRYSEDNDVKLINNGANFIIEFHGVETQDDT